MFHFEDTTTASEEEKKEDTLEFLDDDSKREYLNSLRHKDENPTLTLLDRLRKLM